MKYKVGDSIEFGGLKGKIESASINSKIGFLEEGRREPTYTIRFENIPESKLFIQNGTNREDTTEPAQKKRKSTSRKGKLHPVSNKSIDK